jgi:hypothetical protein
MYGVIGSNYINKRVLTIALDGGGRQQIYARQHSDEQPGIDEFVRE